MEKIKVLQTRVDTPALLKKIGDILGAYDVSTVILATSKATMFEIEKQCGVKYPVAKFGEEIAYGRSGTTGEYLGYTVLQNDEIPFGEVKIMIEVA